MRHQAIRGLETRLARSLRGRRSEILPTVGDVTNMGRGESRRNCRTGGNPSVIRGGRQADFGWNGGRRSIQRTITGWRTPGAAPGRRAGPKIPDEEREGIQAGAAGHGEGGLARTIKAATSRIT